MTPFSKRIVATVGLSLAAACCFAGAVQNGIFAVAGAIDPERLHRHARIWFTLASAAAGLALASAAMAFRARRSRPPTVRAGAAATSSGERSGLYVDTTCCITCGIPWTYAPDIFREGEHSCLVARQPSGATELRRTLRVFRHQELTCVRYGGRNPRVLHILRRVNCAATCDELDQR